MEIFSNNSGDVGLKFFFLIFTIIAITIVIKISAIVSDTSIAIDLGVEKNRIKQGLYSICVGRPGSQESLKSAPPGIIVFCENCKKAKMRGIVRVTGSTLAQAIFFKIGKFPLKNFGKSLIKPRNIAGASKKITEWAIIDNIISGQADESIYTLIKSFNPNSPTKKRIKSGAKALDKKVDNLEKSLTIRNPNNRYEVYIILYKAHWSSDKQFYSSLISAIDAELNKTKYLTEVMKNDYDVYGYLRDLETESNTLKVRPSVKTFLEKQPTKKRISKVIQEGKLEGQDLTENEIKLLKLQTVILNVKERLAKRTELINSLLKEKQSWNIKAANFIKEVHNHPECAVRKYNGFSPCMFKITCSLKPGSEGKDQLPTIDKIRHFRDLVADLKSQTGAKACALSAVDITSINLDGEDDIFAMDSIYYIAVDGTLFGEQWMDYSIKKEKTSHLKAIEMIEPTLVSGLANVMNSAKYCGSGKFPENKLLLCLEKTICYTPPCKICDVLTCNYPVECHPTGTTRTINAELRFINKKMVVWITGNIRRP